MNAESQSSQRDENLTKFASAFLGALCVSAFNLLFTTLDVHRSPGFNACMSNPSTDYTQFIAELRETGLLSSIASILNWDERTQLPTKGSAYRADQLSLLAKMQHQRFTSNAFRDLLSRVEDQNRTADADSDIAVNIRETRRSFDRAVKLPEKLVEELTRVSVLAQHAWVGARAKSDFASFAPWLEQIVSLKRQEAECIGYKDHPYNALLDEFEPGETAANLRGVFDSLREPLVDLIGRISQSSHKPKAEILERQYDRDVQARLAREAAAAIGFDFEAGRLDVSVHPFCTTLGPADVRLTTRFDERYFADAFFGTLHETGHGLYNQGLPADHYGTPRGEYVSLGIHESQSRMWENLVGRSGAFWKFFLPKARAAFPSALKDVSESDWYGAINAVTPSFIRTESDEATYNLHVLIRFELELALMSNDLAVKDLPAAWNEKMKKYLGITPPDDARGCLQDIHWSGGAIGYFPTYTLGNLYAAQFYDQAKKDVTGLETEFTIGNFSPLLDWLRKNIHTHGKTFSAGQLVKRITGKPLSAEALLKHLNGVAAILYRV